MVKITIIEGASRDAFRQTWKVGRLSERPSTNTTDDLDVYGWIGLDRIRCNLLDANASTWIELLLLVLALPTD